MVPRSSLAGAPRPLFLVLAVGFLLITALSAGREWYRQTRVKDEVAALQDRVARLEERRSGLSGLLAEWNAPETVDREARRRLNLQRPGERVYVLRGDAWEAVAAAATATAPTLYQEGSSEPRRSNPERWFRFFFFRASAEAAKP